MTTTKMRCSRKLPSILLCCAATASAVWPAEELLVRPGDRIALAPVEPGERVEAALDGGPLRPVDKGVDAPAEGNHWLAVASRDPAGNLSPVRWMRLRVDEQAPTVELETEPLPVRASGKAWLPPGSRAVARASDDLAGIGALFLEIGEERREVPVAGATGELVGELPGAGDVLLRAWASDGVDNQSDPLEVAVAVDPAPPEGEIRAEGSAIDTADGWVLGPTARLEATVHDLHSGVAEWKPRLDGEEVGQERWQAPWVAGSHHADLEAVDLVGNRAIVGSRKFQVDADGPTIDWRVSSEGVEVEGEMFYGGAVQVQVSATDNLAGVGELSWAVPGGVEQPVSGVVETVMESLQLSAVDRVGNHSRVVASWRIDTSGPELSVEGPGGRSVVARNKLAISKDQHLVLRATDPGSGVERVSYRLGTIGKMAPVPEQLVFPRAGTYELHLQAVDRLGNSTRDRWLISVSVPKPSGGGR